MARFFISISNDNGPETDSDTVNGSLEEAADYARSLVDGRDNIFAWATATRVYADQTPEAAFATYDCSLDAVFSASKPEGF